MAFPQKTYPATMGKRYDHERIALARDAYARADTPEAMMEQLRQAKIPSAHMPRLNTVELTVGEDCQGRWWQDVRMLRARFPFPKSDAEPAIDV